MDKIIRTITSDGAVTAACVDCSDIVFTAQGLHKTSPSATAAFGRLLAAGSLMGANLKQNNGKLNVAKAVGKDGTLGVIRDYGTGEPYVGQVPLVSGEIAEDITNYFAVSEQIPTVCALGVLLDKEDEKVLFAGGLLIQLLPGAFEDTIEKLEKNISNLEPITTMFAKGMSILDICKTALEGFEVEVLDEFPVNYVCGCSREKIESYFRGLPEEELRACIGENGKAEVQCRFCNKNYSFTEDDIEKIIKNKK